MFYILIVYTYTIYSVACDCMLYILYTMNTYIHTYIHTWIHTYIHTYIHVLLREHALPAMSALFHA